MTIVAEYTTTYEAVIAKGLLESEGIMSAVMNNDSMYGMMLSNTGVRLAVNPEDYDRAVEILTRTDFDQLGIDEAELEAQAEAAATEEDEL